MNKILIIGSGELGHAITTTLHEHPSFDPSSYSLTTSLRPSTLASPPASRQQQLSNYRSQNIALIPLDIESATLEDLTQAFIPFTTIIHAGGMTIPSGTQIKITRAALASAKDHPTSTPKLYIPWQFGLDYDAIGPKAGGGLFAEQYQIRELLRSQHEVKWVIVSNGIFTSFMFEPVWGVVERNDSENSSDSDSDIVVRALGSWDDKLVATTAEDIARCTTELVLVDTDIRDTPVFIAGDCCTYREYADMVERVAGKQVRRELWDTPGLLRKLEAEPENKLRKYHVVFSQGCGTSWPMDETYNAKKGMKMEGVEGWLRRCFNV